MPPGLQRLGVFNEAGWEDKIVTPGRELFKR
jgi:hypothetical protein